MDLRFGLILLVIFSIVVKSSSVFNDAAWGRVAHIGLDPSQAKGSINCNGQVGDCIDEAEEMMLDSEASRQALAIAQRFISYKAFQKDHVPCNLRGQSYYACNKKGRPFP